MAQPRRLCRESARGGSTRTVDYDLSDALRGSGEVTRRHSSSEVSNRDVRGSVLNRSSTMRDRIPCTLAPRFEDEYKAVEVQTRACLSLSSCPLAQQPASCLRNSKNTLLLHPDEQRSAASLDSDRIDQSLVHERPESSGFAGPDSGVDVCNNSTIEVAHTASGPVARKTGLPSLVEHPAPGSALSSLALPIFGAAVASSHLTPAPTHGRYIPEMRPALPTAALPSLTSCQETDPRRTERNARAVEAVNQAVRTEAAKLQICESKAPLGADALITGSNSVRAASECDHAPVAGGTAEGPTGAVSELAAARLTCENPKNAKLFEKNCFEEARENQTDSSAHFSVCSSGHQQVKRQDLLSTVLRRSQLNAVFECVQGQKLPAALLEKQPQEPVQMLQHELAKQDEAVGQAQHQRLQEASMRADRNQRQRTGREKCQEREVNMILERKPDLLPPCPFQRSRCVTSQMNGTYMHDSQDSDAPPGSGEAESRYSRGKLQSLPRVLPCLSPSHPACGPSQTVVDGEDMWSKDVDKRKGGCTQLSGESQLDVVFVDAASAAPPWLHPVAAGETAPLAAGNGGTVGSSGVCTAEDGVVRTGSDADQDRTTRKPGGTEVLKTFVDCVPLCVAAVACMNSRSAEDQSRGNNEGVFLSSGVKGKISQEGSEAGLALSEQAINSSRDSMCSIGRSAENVTVSAYGEKWLHDTWSAEHQNDTVTEGSSTFSSSGGRDDEEMSKTWSSGIPSLCFASGKEDGGRDKFRIGFRFSPSRGDTSPGTNRRYGTSFHEDINEAPVNSNSSKTKDRAGDGGAVRKQWSWVFWRAGSPYARAGKKRCSWPPLVLLKLVALLPRCAAAVCSRFKLHTCGPMCAGAPDAAVRLGEKVSAEHSGHGLGSPQQVSPYCTQQKESEQQEGSQGHTGVNPLGRQHGPRNKSEKEGKLRTKDDTRMRFECCVPSAASSFTTPLGLSKYVLLSIYTLQAFLTGCVYFGWPALSSMLYRSGAYAWLCSPADDAGTATDSGTSAADVADSGTAVKSAASRLYLCNSQDAAVAPLFTVCHVSDCIMCVIAGYLTDHCSPKGVCMFGQSLHAIGWTLLACSSRGFPAYVPAMICIGCGSATANLPLLRIAVLFPRSKATVITVLGAANTGSFAVPSILDAIWRRVGVRANAVTAAATGLTAASSITVGEGSVDVGSSASIIAGAAVLQRAEDGGGWTFTDICLLYLGIGPLCCMLLAAFFLPTRRFALPVESQKNRQRRPWEVETAKQKSRWHWSVCAGTASAASRANPNTDTGADFVASTVTVEQKRECRSILNRAQVWRLWRLCSPRGNNVQQSNHSESQQRWHRLKKPQRLQFPRGEHKQRKDGLQHRHPDCEHDKPCPERCTQRRRAGGASEALHQHTIEGTAQRASEKAMHGSVDCRLSVPVANDTRAQRAKKHHKSYTCTNGTKEADIHVSLEDKRQGIDRNEVVYNNDFSALEGCTAKEPGKLSRGAFAQPAVNRGISNTPASGVCFLSKEPSKQRDGITREGAFVDSSKITYIVKDFLSDKEQKCATAAETDAEAIGAEYKWPNEYIPTDVGHVALTSQKPPATRYPCLRQEVVTSVTCEAAQMQESMTEAPEADGGGTGAASKTASRRVDRDFQLFTPGEKTQADTQHERGRSEENCFERIQAGTVCASVESEREIPKNNISRNVRRERDGHRVLWLSCWKFQMRALWASLALRRQAGSRKEEGSEGERARREEPSIRRGGRRCQAKGRGNVYDDVPHDGGGSHALQPDASNADASAPSILQYEADHTTGFNSTSKSGLVSSSTAWSKASDPTLQPASSLAHVCLSPEFHVARSNSASREPWALGLPYPGGAMATTAHDSLRVTVEAEREKTGGLQRPRTASKGTDAPAAVSRNARNATPDFTPSATRGFVAAAVEHDARICQTSDRCANCISNKALCAAPEASFSAISIGRSSSRGLTGACHGLISAHTPGCPLGEPALTSVDCRKPKPTFLSQCLSVHFACLVLYSGMVSVAMSFMQSSSSRLFSANVLEFMDWALPFSFGPCVFLGKMIDMFGPFPVLLFMNTMGLLSYLCAASTGLEGLHYVSVVAFCVYVSLDSEQIYCYVEYTFRPEHFGRLSGLLLAIDGAMSLVSIPLYDHLTVRKLGGNPLPVAFGIAGLLAFAYLLLTGLWQHRRKFPDPFGLRDSNASQTETDYSKSGRPEEVNEDAEGGASDLQSEFGKLVCRGTKELSTEPERYVIAAAIEVGAAAENGDSVGGTPHRQRALKRHEEAKGLEKEQENYKAISFGDCIPAAPQVPV